MLLPIEETFINMEEQIPENRFNRFKLWFHNLRLPNGMQTAPNPRKISRLLASLWHPRFSRVQLSASTRRARMMGATRSID